MATMKISPPWALFYRKVNAMFAGDKEVHVIYDEDNYDLKLYVENEYKAAALQEMLPETVSFGNVTLTISVFPPNNTTTEGKLEGCLTDEIIEVAFDGNEAFSACRVVELFGRDLVYVLFKKEVVQYFSDNLSDYYGMTSTLYQDIARDIFTSQDNVFYCTDVQDIDKVMWP